MDKVVKRTNIATGSGKLDIDAGRIQRGMAKVNFQRDQIHDGQVAGSRIGMAEPSTAFVSRVLKSNTLKKSSCLKQSPGFNPQRSLREFDRRRINNLNRKKRWKNFDSFCSMVGQCG